MSPPLVDGALGARAAYCPVGFVEERPGLWVVVNTSKEVLRPYRLRCFRVEVGAVFVEAWIVTPVSHGVDGTIEPARRPLSLLPGSSHRDIPCSYFDIEQKDPECSLGYLAEPRAYWHPGERLTLDVRGEIDRMVLIAKKEGWS